jgi:CHAT domain-containing protein
VTLSACETGISEVETGDELLGFIRGFFFAGTSNLVASLWKVDDIATQKLMSQFYTHLTSKDMSLAQALQHAKIDMINSGEYKHPFYWAPFNLYGIGL